MNRKQRIYQALLRMEKSGVISDLMVQGSMPGLRWTFTPAGYSTRAMTTNDVEWFIIGVNAGRYD